jgi:hypothetical protein
MQIPEWIKPAAWGAVGGAVLITIIGFSADWVVTSGSAEEMAEAEVERAVVAALTPVCVAQFRSVAEAARTTHLAALGEESSWQQPDYVEEQGWATMPGTEEPNEEVAEACADKLLELADS